MSIATLHHLPLAPMLARARDALRPGGLLWILDVTRDETAFELARSALAFPLNVLGRLYTTGRLRPPPEVRAAWDAHGATDRYLSVGEVRRAAAEALPGARVRRLLFWRYALVLAQSYGCGTETGAGDFSSMTTRGTSISHMAPFSGSTTSIPMIGHGVSSGVQSRFTQYHPDTDGVNSTFWDL